MPSQIEYCRNFIFKRNFPIHKLFERGCELGLWRLTAHKIAEIFGARLHRRLPGKLATVIDQIEHGHHVFRAYFKHAFLKQYEKFATFLRNELCSNNLNDFGLKKGLDNLDAVLGPMAMRVATFLPFQTTYYLNGHSFIEQIEHGHHVYRAYFKNAFLKQYEKFATFLRNELCSNNLRDFGLKKSLGNLEAVREKFQTITSRFASYQAQWLNVHVDFSTAAAHRAADHQRLGALSRHQGP